LIGNVFIMLFAGHGAFLIIFRLALGCCNLSVDLLRCFRDDGTYARCDTCLLGAA
jgi:hypothetical protein